MCLIFKHERKRVYIAVDLSVYLYLVLQNQFYIFMDNVLQYMRAVRFCADLHYF